MARIKRFTANDSYLPGINGEAMHGYRMLKYTGDLGGGTLSVSSLSLDTDPDTGATIETPVADGKLDAASVDGNGDARKQLAFQTSGPIKVTLSGATDPDCKVIVE
ncbi:hypothetical protein [Rhizobium sp. PAMB 3182]